MNQALYYNKSENQFHTIILISAMTLILSLLGWILFGIWGAVIGVCFTTFGLFLGPRFSARMILRMYKAQRITPQNAPELLHVFEELCRRGQLSPLPALYYIPSRLPNAFAIGIGPSAAVAVTDGIIRLLNPRELTSVLAHEVAHLMHHDTRVMSLADMVARICSLISRLGMMIIFLSGSTILMSGNGWQVALAGLIMFFAPTMIGLLQLALSRTREFNADMGAAQLTGDPMGLASALEKLDSILRQGRLVKSEAIKQPNFLRTHPPTAERVRELMDVYEMQKPKERPIQPPHQRPQTNRRGEPVIYIGFPKVRQPDRYHARSGIWH